MSWTRAILYLCVAGLLGVAYRATRPSAPPPAYPAPSSTAPAGIAITAVRIESNGRRAQLARGDDRWRVTDPAGAEVASDLIAALITAVLDTPAEPVASDAKHLEEFGLDAPATRITFERPGAAPVTLDIGTRNPAETGVYGRLEGNPQVVLMGLNVQYYVDLVMRGVSPAGAVRARGDEGHAVD